MDMSLIILFTVALLTSAVVLGLSQAVAVVVTRRHVKKEQRRSHIDHASGW